jgi:hypothetical protein
LKYRFLIAEWSWVGGGDGTAGVLPTVAPPALPAPLETNADYSFVKVGGLSRVGDLYYTGSPNPFFPTPVYITAANQDAQGWITLDGLSVEVPQSGGGTVFKNVTDTDPQVSFLRSGLLMDMDSVAVTSKHASRRPAWASNPAQAGRALTAAEQEPIRRYRMVFQVRDAVTGADVWTDVLDSIIFDNTDPVMLLNLEELLSSECNPIAGLSQIHVRYTADHPHLQSFRMDITHNYQVTVHSSPAPGVAPGVPPTDMPRGDFPTAPPDYTFRGNASGMAAGTGPIDISADPICAYSVKLYYLTRKLHTSESFVEVLYCKE